jgi:hypothetical protein
VVSFFYWDLGHRRGDERGDLDSRAQQSRTG